MQCTWIALRFIFEMSLQEGCTALVMACQVGNKEIVDILLEHDADVNLQLEVINQEH